MPTPESASTADEALRAVLRSSLSQTIMTRLEEVCERSRLSIAEVIAQAADFAWHVQMSGEFDRRPVAPSQQPDVAPEIPPETYNGWQNYETWATSRWLNNDEATCNHCRGLARAATQDAPNCEQARDQIWTADEAKKFLLADRLREYVEEMNPLTDEATLFTDLLNAAISEINWHEIAETFLDDEADSNSVA